MFWGLIFKHERITAVTLQHVGKSSLYSSLASQHPTVLSYCYVSKQMSHRKISDKNIALLKNSHLCSYSASFLFALLHQSLWFQWENTRPLLQMIFGFENLQYLIATWKKERHVCFQMDQIGQVFVMHNYLQPYTRLMTERKEKKSFVFKHILYISLLFCLLPRTHVWCRAHTLMLREVTATIILLLESAL